MIITLSLNFKKQRGGIIKTILLLFFSSLLFAQSYPYFTQEELIRLDKSNTMSKNRVLHYKHKMQEFDALSKENKLKKVNLYLNSLLSQYDDITHKEEDKWATPKEFLALGYGDCEDYVLIKYYSLIKLGFDEKNLYITVVKESFKNSMHMVLTYFQQENRAPLVLDNLSFKILNLEQRVDLEAIYFINNSGVYTINEKFQLQKLAEVYKPFEDLKVKVSKNL